jgi:hypothetical protein
MTDVAALTAALGALKAARRSGVRSVIFGERQVVYRNDPELMAQIAALESEIAAAAGSPKPTTVLVRSNKGFL